MLQGQGQVMKICDVSWKALQADPGCVEEPPPAGAEQQGGRFLEAGGGLQGMKRGLWDPL